MARIVAVQVGVLITTIINQSSRFNGRCSLRGNNNNHNRNSCLSECGLPHRPLLLWPARPGFAKGLGFRKLPGRIAYGLLER